MCQWAAHAGWEKFQFFILKKIIKVGFLPKTSFPLDYPQRLQ